MIVLSLLGLLIRLGEKLYRWLICKKFRPSADEALQKNIELRTMKFTVLLQFRELKQNITNFKDL